MSALEILTMVAIGIVTLNTWILWFQHIFDFITSSESRRSPAFWISSTVTLLAMLSCGYLMSMAYNNYL